MANFILRCGYKALQFLPLEKYFKNQWAGCGTILTLHQVVHAQSSAAGFEGANTVEFLDEVLTYLKSASYDLLSMNEVEQRLQAGASIKNHRPFVSFTFDDGYRNNLELAYPLFKRHQVPFTLYVATDFIDRQSTLWTYLLQEIIQKQSEIAFHLGSVRRIFSLKSTDQKRQAYRAIKKILVRDKSKTPIEHFETLFGKQVDAKMRAQHMHEMFLSWDELKQLSSDPLVTIGSHSVRHVPLNRLSSSELEHELMTSKLKIESHLNKAVQHFAFPFGTYQEVGPREHLAVKQCEYLTGVTSRFGHISLKDQQHLTALPRLPLNASLENIENFKILLTGLPASLISFFIKS